jgi:hypothetical protein
MDGAHPSLLTPLAATADGSEGQKVSGSVAT